jgi:hypothetical protein
MEEVIGSIPTSKSKYLANPTFSKKQQLPPMESSVGSAHRRISGASVLPTGRESRQRLDFAHNESGKEDQDAAISVAD